MQVKLLFLQDRHIIAYLKKVQARNFRFVFVVVHYFYYYYKNAVPNGTWRILILSIYKNSVPNGTYSGRP